MKHTGSSKRRNGKAHRIMRGFDKLHHNISETFCCSLRIGDSPQLAVESFNTGGNMCIGEKIFRRTKGAP
jgi:hypothetical protein